MSFVQGGQGRTKCEEGGGGQNQQLGRSEPSWGKGYPQRENRTNPVSLKTNFSIRGEGRFPQFLEQQEGEQCEERGAVPYIKGVQSSLSILRFHDFSLTKNYANPQPTDSCGLRNQPIVLELRLIICVNGYKNSTNLVYHFPRLSSFHDQKMVFRDFPRAGDWHILHITKGKKAVDTVTVSSETCSKQTLIKRVYYWLQMRNTSVIAVSPKDRCTGYVGRWFRLSDNEENRQV